MVHHIVLYKLRPEVNEETIESMMRNTRIYLLRIPEVLAVRCGKCIDANSKWPFFLEVDVDSMEKLQIYTESPDHVKFVETIIKPNITERLAINYESEPGKDVRYS